MTTAEKKTSTKKEPKSLMEIEIVRYSDIPKPKLTPAQREQVIEEISASIKRAMGKRFRQRWGKILEE